MKKKSITGFQRVIILLIVIPNNEILKNNVNWLLNISNLEKITKTENLCIYILFSIFANCMALFSLIF